MMRPETDCKHTTNKASGHSSVVALTPNPIVVCVSRENRNVEVKEKMLVTQGCHLFLTKQMNCDNQNKSFYHSLISLTLIFRQMFCLQVPVNKAYQVPNCPKEQPTPKKTERERKQRISPLNVDQSRENILQKLEPVFCEFGMHHIAVSIFEYHSSTVVSKVGKWSKSGTTKL